MVRLAHHERNLPFNCSAEPVLSAVEGFKSFQTNAGMRPKEKLTRRDASTFRQFPKRRNEQELGWGK